MRRHIKVMIVTTVWGIEYKKVAENKLQQPDERK